jgi:hypothetical protein
LKGAYGQEIFEGWTLMKRTLTMKRIGRLTEPGRYYAGANLYLQRSASGAMSWIYRYESRVELLDLPRLTTQLCSLERRTARGGRDTIDHAPGAHDDIVNAAAGAIVAASQRAAQEVPITPPIIFYRDGSSSDPSLTDQTDKRSTTARFYEWAGGVGDVTWWGPV